MTNYIYDGTITGTITAPVASYDWHLFTKDTTFDVASGPMFFSTGVTYGLIVDLYGTYEVNSGYVINLSGTFDGGGVATGVANNRVTIHEGAELTSYAGTAILALGRSNSVMNLGMLSGSTGIQLTGANTTLQNSGTITGVNFPVYVVQNSGTFDLMNDGLITGPYRAIYTDSTGTRFNIVNTGTIRSGTNDAMQLTGQSGADHFILNEGFIGSGSVALDIDADTATGGTLFTTNSGTIHGTIDIIEMVDVFQNTGMINGQLDLNDLDDKLFNHGTVMNDILLGVGNDVYRGAGSVLGDIDGEDGDDRFYVHGDVGAIDGGADTDVVYSSVSLGDVSDVETIILRGNAQTHIDATVTGTTAAFLRGTDGDNDLTGGGDDDIIKGRKGEDRLTGGAGGDDLWGGDDADVFVYVSGTDLENLRGASDWIMDFETGVDLIDLSAITALSPLVFIDTAQFSGSGTTGEIRYRVAAGDGEIQIDLDGDGNRDVLLTVDNVITFTADDFIL